MARNGYKNKKALAMQEPRCGSLAKSVSTQVQPPTCGERSTECGIPLVRYSHLKPLGLLLGLVPTIGPYSPLLTRDLQYIILFLNYINLKFPLASIPLMSAPFGFLRAWKYPAMPIIIALSVVNFISGIKRFNFSFSENS